MAYTGISPAMNPNPNGSELLGMSSDDGTSRVGRYRAKRMRDVLDQYPNEGYQSQVKRVNGLVDQETNHGAELPDAQELSSGGRPNMGAMPTASSPTTIDLNKDAKGQALPMSFGNQGPEGMLLMKKYEPDAYSAVQDMAGQNKAKMYAKINGKEFVGIPRAGVSEYNIQKARAEAYRDKLEKMREANITGQRQHELALAKMPSENRIAEATAIEKIHNSNPEAQLGLELKRAQLEDLRSQIQERIADRKSAIPTQQRTQAAAYQSFADKAMEKGDTATAAKAMAKSMELLGNPIDQEMVSALAAPTTQQKLAKRSDQEMEMAQGLEDLDTKAADAHGVANFFTGRGSKETVGFARSLLQDFIDGGMNEKVARAAVMRTLRKHGLNLAGF